MGSGLTGGLTPSMMSPESMSSKQAECHLTQAFKFFDNDNTGFISKLNIKTMLSHYGGLDDVEDEVVEYLISEVDKNGDGKIDLMEFLSMMLSRYQDE